MTDTIREQILAIRDTGLTNMFDVPMVQRLAYERGYYELALYLEDHRKEYDLTDCRRKDTPSHNTRYRSPRRRHES